jgi:hypothetical protein
MVHFCDLHKECMHRTYSSVKADPRSTAFNKSYDPHEMSRRSVFCFQVIVVM